MPRSTDAHIAYDVAGEGPALVLIHAGIADRRMWDDQIPAFSRDYQVVRYDIRGFGESTMPPTDYANHEDLAGLLDHLEIAQAHVLGISMGGKVALDFTLAHPDRVTSLIRVSADLPETPVSDVLKRAWDDMKAAEENNGLSDVIELEINLWVDGPNRKPGTVNQRVRDRVREMNTALFARIVEHDAATENRITPPTIERLQEIQVPTLNIVGEEDVPDVHTAAQLLKEGIRTAKMVNVPGAAHMVSMEKPEEFNDIVLEFLGSLESHS